jgi:phosphatidate cytidylyltransferase
MLKIENILHSPIQFYTLLVVFLYISLGLFIWIKPLEDAKKPFLTWFIMLPFIFVPLWLGEKYWVIAVGILSIYGFKEFAKGTGLYNQKTYCIVSYLAILAITVSIWLNSYGVFMAIPVWFIAIITAIPVITQNYEKSIQNIALSSIGIIYFGWFLAHLAFLAQSEYGLGYVLFVIIFTQFNDALCFIWGKLFGKTKFTRISPNKTIEGSILALISTTLIAFANWDIAFPHFEWWLVLLVGILISLGGQIGDLVMSSFKRDLDIKDFGSLLPGHGGILDRIDSLLWVSPLFFHLVRFFHGGFGHG